MITDFFLAYFHANDDAKSPEDPNIVRGIDNRLISGYDAKEIAWQLGTLSTEKNVAQTVFLNRLALAYLFMDTGFDNTSWGYDYLSFVPMVYIPREPYLPVWTRMKYRWGELYITPDLLITTQKNPHFTAEMCKLLISWFSSRKSMSLDYIRANGVRDISTWSTCFTQIDSQAELAYQSIICGYTNDADFYAWVEDRVETDTVVAIRESGLTETTARQEIVLDLILEYLNTKLTTVAGSQPSKN